MTSLLRATLVAALLVLVSGCGVPTDEGAQTAPAGEVPFGLLDEERQPAVGDDLASRVTVGVYLHFDDGGLLIRVERRVADTDLGTLVEELEREPDTMEAAVGLRSALTDIDAVVSTDREGDLATIDLAPDFGEISGSDQLVALAQIVFTVTDRPGIDRVNFTLDGAAVEIPTGSGSLTSGTVTRDDYQDLEPAS